jgi:putative transposase
MRYRRTTVAGGTYFFTVNLAQRERTLLVDRVDVLGAVLRMVRRRHPFHSDAMVILPDHLHAIWTLPAGDCDFPTRWMLIKAGFSRQVASEERRSRSRIVKGERGIWQRRYWEHLIRYDEYYARHVEYIHYNPVKHGYVVRAVDWPYSSIHRYIEAGMMDHDWGGGICGNDKSGYGERE